MRDMLLDLPSLWVPADRVSHNDDDDYPEGVVSTVNIKPILFLFLAGAVDIAVTLLVIFMDWGVESTIYYNWITPVWLMCLYMIVVNLVFCLALLHFTNHLSKRVEIFGIRAALIVLSASLYVFGFARLMFGAWPGVLIAVECVGI
jgi:hypothetical protein